MAEKLKDYYNAEYLEELADRIGAVCEAFDRALFREETAEEIGNLEFNDRQELVARALRKLTLDNDTFENTGKSRFFERRTSRVLY